MKSFPSVESTLDMQSWGSNKAGEIDFSTVESKHSILDVPFYVTFLNNLQTCFAKVLSCIVVHPAFGYIYAVFLGIQLIIPAYFNNCTDLWPSDNFFSFIFNVLAYLWEGLNPSLHYSRMIAAFCIELLIFIVFIYLSTSVLKIQKNKRIGRGELYFSFFIFDIFIPIILPYLVSTLPNCIYSLVKGQDIALSIVSLVLGIFISGSSILLILFFVSPRVIFWNVPMQEWLYGAKAIFTSCAILCSVSGICSAIIPGKIRCIFPLILLIMHIILVIYLFLFSPLAKRTVNLVFSSLHLTAAVVCLLQFINFLLPNPFKPEVPILVSVFVFIASFLFFRLINNRFMLKTLNIFDQCMDNPIQSESILNDNFKSPIKLISAMRSTFELCHPYIFKMEIFDWANIRFPNNQYLLLFYARFLSMFPSNNRQMMWTVALIAKTTNFKQKSSYLYQFRNVARSRQTITSEYVMEQIEDINEQMEDFMIYMRRFWENILQNNISNFWEDIRKAQDYINELDNDFYQLNQEYPNVRDVLNLHLKYQQIFKRDYNEINEIKNKIDMLEKELRTQPDFAMSNALATFPILYTILQQVDTKNNTLSSKFDTNLMKNKDDDLDESNQNLMKSMQELISHSKLGKIYYGIIITIITVIISIGLYVLFYYNFKNGFTNKLDTSINFLTQIQEFLFDVALLTNEIDFYPHFMEGYPIYIDPNDDNIMKIIAPNLYPDHIGKINFTKDFIVSHIGTVQDKFNSLINSLSSLDLNDEAAQRVVYLFNDYEAYEGMAAKTLISNMLMNVFEVMNYNSPHDFFFSPEFTILYTYFPILFQVMLNCSEYTVEFTSYNYENNLQDINEYMALCVILTIVLVSLPFIYIVYHLSSQFDSVAQSFISFPNTEIRNVINQFGSDDKTNDDLTHISKFNHGANQKTHNYILIMIIFLFSFIGILVCTLIIHYYSILFTSSAVTVGNLISTLYMPFTFMLNGLYALDRLSQIDIYPLLDQSPTNRSYFYLNANTYLQYSVSYFSSSVWSDIAGINIFYQATDEQLKMFPTFDDVFSPDNAFLSIKSPFENIASSKFSESIDLILMQALTFLGNHADGKLNPVTVNDEEYLSLVYLDISFMMEYRINPYIYLVKNYTNDEIQKYDSINNILLIVAIVWSVLTCILIIIYYVLQRFKMNMGLKFYLYFSPEQISRNQNAITLIETGKKVKERLRNGYGNAEFILKKLKKGVVIINKEFVIVDYNDAFMNLFQNYDNFDKIEGMYINDLIVQEENDDSWGKLLQHIDEALNGKRSPQFTENISIKMKTGETGHFICNISCLTPDRAANVDHEYMDIESIAIVFSDCTEIFMRNRILQHEQAQITAMLSKVLPEKLINNLEQENDIISFIVQSVTIGQISIIPKINDNENFDPFVFYDNVFNTFDEEIQKYDLLCKSNSFNHTYTFIGGLFSEINKPDRHAEESIRFCIDLLSQIKKTSEKVGIEYDLKIGVHTGGPIVAGVMSFSRPSLQVIGSVMDMTLQMMVTGHVNNIHITRAVYELVFSAGFNVQELGETKIRDGKSIPTYTIIPQTI